MAHNSFSLEDYSGEVASVLKSKAEAWLMEAGGELEAQVKRNTRVNEGELKSKWQYKVDKTKLEAQVGNPLENAIWEEFGTGEFALNGDGRKTPWFVPVEGYTGKKKPTYNGKVVIVYGKDGKQFYKTNGKAPSRALFSAFTKLKPKLIKLAEEKFKGIK